ncbi:MAG: hypothetical protein ACM3S1_16435 [Hyphomicrobiales bacterium]
MDLDERFHDGLATLEILRAELLDAREAAKVDPSTWGNWARGFNQRLHSHRLRLAILLEPPAGADRRLVALYGAAKALRGLYEEMNRALEGGHVDIARKRVEFETALHHAREAIGQVDL